MNKAFAWSLGYLLSDNNLSENIAGYERHFIRGCFDKNGKFFVSDSPVKTNGLQTVSAIRYVINLDCRRKTRDGFLRIMHMKFFGKER